jgi:hypothetical protein
MLYRNTIMMLGCLLLSPLLMPGSAALLPASTAPLMIAVRLSLVAVLTLLMLFESLLSPALRRLCLLVGGCLLVGCLQRLTDDTIGLLDGISLAAAGVCLLTASLEGGEEDETLLPVATWWQYGIQWLSLRLAPLVIAVQLRLRQPSFLVTAY